MAAARSSGDPSTIDASDAEALAPKMSVAAFLTTMVLAKSPMQRADEQLAALGAKQSATPV